MNSLLVWIMLAVAVSTPEMPAELVHLDRETAVGANIFRFYRSVAELNASIGEEPISFDVPAATAERIRRSIAVRVTSDVEEHCGGDSADATYLLVGERQRTFIAFVIRISDGTVDGAYVPLCGLHYYSDKATNLLLRVTSDSY